MRNPFRELNKSAIALRLSSGCGRQVANIAGKEKGEKLSKLISLKKKKTVKVKTDSE